MPEYIDRDKAITGIIACKRVYGSLGDGIRVLDAYDVVRLLPSVDVRENVPGHWIFTPNRGYVCSACGSSVGYDSRSDFCPDCGADMREVRNENDL